MDIPDNLKYTKEHEWARIEGEEIVCGVTSFAQNELGDIVFVEMPEVGAEVKQLQAFGVVESVKAVSDMFAPLSGKVTRVNEELIDSPALVNQDPYGKGWMVAIRFSQNEELQKLMSAEEYRAHVGEAGQS